MNTNKTFAAMVAVALLLSACQPESPPTPMIPKTGSESIGTISAEETLVEYGLSDNLIQVTNSQIFLNNSTVRVTKGGIARLDFSVNQISIRLFNDTAVGNVRADPAGTPDRAVRMKLVFGGLSGEVAKNGTPIQFEIANGVNVYILGTQFIVLYDPETTTTYIGNFDGTVAYTIPGQQSVQFIQSGLLYEISSSFEINTRIMNFTRADIDSLTLNSRSTLLTTLRGYLDLTPTPTSTATPTLAPTIPSTLTQVPTLTPTPTRITSCDRAAFVADVSVPDGTSFSPGVQFTKVWRLRNVGTCTWTNSYTLVFSGGEQMSGPVSVNLPASVAPGQTVDISINLIAPTLPGSYRGEWILRNASGTSFGVGTNGTGPIWVSINVITTTITVTVVSPSRITGHVYANSVPQSGFSVSLFDSTGNTELTSIVTDASGMYTFPNLSAGTYSVKWIGENCSGNNVPGVAQITVNAGETKTHAIDVTVLC